MAQKYPSDTVLIYNVKGEPIAFVPRDFAEKHRFIPRAIRAGQDDEAASDDTEPDDTLSLFEVLD